MKTQSGRVSFRTLTRSGPASRPTTSWPSVRSASSTRAPERSETWRSSDRPPFKTPTRTSASPAAKRQDVRVFGRLRGHDRLLRGQGLVQRHLLGDDLADPPDALADLVLGRPR